MVGVFTPWKWANTINHTHPLAAPIYQQTTAWHVWETHTGLGVRHCGFVWTKASHITFSTCVSQSVKWDNNVYIIDKVRQYKLTQSMVAPQTQASSRNYVIVSFLGIKSSDCIGCTQHIGWVPCEAKPSSFSVGPPSQRTLAWRSCFSLLILSIVPAFDLPSPSHPLLPIMRNIRLNHQILFYDSFMAPYFLQAPVWSP